MVSLGKHTRAGHALSLKKLVGLLVAGFVASPAYAENGYTYSLFGTVGLLDMPTAESADDAELATTLSMMSEAIRSTITFQLTPRFAASFR